MPVDRPDPAAGSPSRSLTGRSVGGRYRLEQVLGRGAMGVVWAARDELLERDVAIKEVIPPSDIREVERAALRTRTLREARTAARISAEGAVAIYDVVEDDGRPWIVMERLPATTLADELAEHGPLSTREAAEVGASLLAGLSAAHAAGVLHRDVKPANVLFRPGPGGRRAVLGDFGIAHVDGDATMTATTMAMGSPAYVAPERAQGRPATAASDLWSLGVTLWAAVEGRSPFHRENALAALTAVVTEEVPPAPHAGALGSLLDGLLRKDPAERVDAETARGLLAAVLAGGPGEGMSTTQVLPVEEPPAAAGPLPPSIAPATGPDVVPTGDDGDGWWEPAAPQPVPARRPRPRAGLVLATLLVLGVVGAGAVWLWPDDETPVAAQEEPAAPTVPEASEPAAEPEATEPEPEAEPEPEPPAPEPTEPAAPDPPPDQGGPATVPDGFELYTDPSGFSVAVPAGWQVERDGPRVYLRDPGSRAYLLVDQTDEPKADPVADWQAQEPAVAERLDSYSRIGEIRPVDFRGWRAADWEFVFGEGRATHVLNRNVVTGPTKAYALYWSVPSAQWDAMLPIHEQVVASFQPVG